MSSNIFQNICRIHNSDIVAIKLSPHKQLDDILMCVHCLTGNAQQSVVPISEIQNLYEIKCLYIKQVQTEKHQQINISLSKIIDCLNQLKIEMNASLNQGIQLIENQLQLNNQRSLSKQINLENSKQTFEDQIKFIFKSEFGYSQQEEKEEEFGWIQGFSQQLQKFNTFQEIQYCFLILEDLKKQILLQDQNIKSQCLIQKQIQLNFYDQSSERTPKLDLNCPIHGKEIILFDINQHTDRDRRLCCIECMPYQYVSLTKAQEKWKQFEVRKSNYFQQQLLDKEKQYEYIQKQIINIEFQIIQQIKNQRINFEDNFFVMKQKIVQCLNLIKQDFKNLNYTELQDRIEFLSKPQEYQQRLIFQEYQEIQDSVLQQLKDSQKQLQGYQQNLYDNLRSMLCNSQEISKTTSLSDQQNYFNNTNYFIVENRDNTHSNQLEFLTQRSQESQDYRNNNELQIEYSNNNTLQTLQITNENRQTRSASDQVKSKIKENDIQKIIENQEAIQDEKYYELIEKYSQEQSCYAISFNYDNQIMISGCQNDITVWEFNNGKIIKKQQLIGHSNLVISLYFSFNKNEFISGSTDKSIRYWQLIENEWICTQILLGHKRQIDCILLDNKGNQILSCSSDKSIRVWRKNEQLKWIQVQVLNHHQAYVRCISLSKSQELLVSCAEDRMIIIWELDALQEWKLKQTIRNVDYGYRICFVDNQYFILQPRNINCAIIFQWNQNLNQFVQSNQNLQLIESNNGYQNFFPSLYSERKQVIINKHGSYVYVIKKQNNNKFQISQIIKVSHYCNYGTLSRNGEYLVIWDEESRNFLIRKAKF